MYKCTCTCTQCVYYFNLAMVTALIYMYNIDDIAMI